MKNNREVSKIIKKRKNVEDEDFLEQCNTSTINNGKKYEIWKKYDNKKVFYRKIKCEAKQF